MRLLLFLVVICFVLALICLQVPTMFLHMAWGGWLTVGFIFWALDLLLGGWALPVGVVRR